MSSEIQKSAVPYLSVWGGRCSLLRHLLFAILVLLPTGRTQAADKTDSPGESRSVVFQLGEGKRSKYGFRIPALAVSKSGQLLAFAERRIGLHDHAENDIVLRRSQDDGRTWGPLQIVAEEGTDSLNDPCVVVLDSGRILLRYTRFPQGVHARNSKHTVIADSGYEGPKTVRLYRTHSDDEGQTWSQPRDVTRAMRRESAISVGSPGVGLQLTRGPHRGRVVLPNYEVYHRGDGKRDTANSVSFSDDGGDTWQLSDTIVEPSGDQFGNEAQVAELQDGGILLSARDFGGGKHRELSVSRDGGQTWSAHRIAHDLETPPCMSSVLRYSWPKEQSPGLLLHTLPHTKNSRSNGTIMLSQDDGETWKPALVVEPGSFEYSCLARLPNGDIGLLYETNRCLSTVFRRVSPDALK